MILSKKNISFLSILIFQYCFPSEIYYNKLSNESPYLFTVNSVKYLYIAKTDEDKMYVLYFTARSYYKLKENTKAITKLVELEKLVSKYRNPVISTKIYGKIAYLYKYLNFNWKAKAMLEQSNRISLQIPVKKDFYEARAYFYFYIAITSNDLYYCLQVYNKANNMYKLLEAIDSNANSVLGHDIAINLGDAYFAKEDLKKSLYFNFLALKRNHDEQQAGTAYLNIGMIYSRLNKRDSALIYYKKSILPLRSESNIEYLNESFDSIKSIYMSEENIHMAQHYSDMQEKTLSRLANMDNEVIKTLEQEGKNIHTEKKGNQIYSIAVLILCILFMLLLYKLRKRPGKPREISDFQTDNINSHEGICTYNELEENLVQNKLLLLLKEYEKKQFYTDPNITLAKVAVNLNTTTQNVSELINKSKGMNFSSYINTLRIEYIINLLDNNPKYTSYKIAYLATLCGFLSHSTFTKSFKNIKGISPSEYIDIINANTEYKNKG